MKKLVDGGVEKVRIIELPQQPLAFREVVGCQSVVIPQEGDVVAGRQVDRGVPAIGNGQELLGAVVDDALVAQSACKTTDVLCRRVVEDDQFPVRLRLTKDGFDGITQEIQAIVGWDDDRKLHSWVLPSIDSVLLA